MNRCLRFIYKDYLTNPFHGYLQHRVVRTVHLVLSPLAWLGRSYHMQKPLTFGTWRSWHRIVTLSRQKCQPSQVLSVSAINFVSISVHFDFVKLLFESHPLAHPEANSDTSPTLLASVPKHPLPLYLRHWLWYNVGIHWGFWKCPMGSCLVLDFPVEKREESHLLDD